MTDNPMIQTAPLAATAAQLRNDDLSLSDMLAMVQERFTAIEPSVEAFIPGTVDFARLQEDAAALEKQYPDPATRPPLYGVLVGIKDIFHVEGFITRAGTAVPPEAIAGKEGAAVKKLKQAGALIAGKTVTTEFAYFEPGPTRNPHNTAHTPGGSSSGSAAAVAAGLVPLATGTQTVGSVIRPAAYCGIVGFKPSFDRIDTSGMIYFSPSMDHVGLFTQDVAGMQLAASVLVEAWDSGITVSKKPVLAIPQGEYLAQSTALTEFEAQVKQLQNAGYTVKRIPTLNDINHISDLHSEIIAAELARGHVAWYAEYGDLYRPRTASLIEYGKDILEADLHRAREHSIGLRDTLHSLLDEHDADLWISPPAPDVAPEGIGATGSPAMNLPWTNAGLPAVTVPAGTGDKGLPVGLQLCAPYGEDERLLAYADEIARVLV